MGLELNEVLQLKVRHLDLRQGVAQIPTLRRKGQRSTVIPKKIHSELAELVSIKQADDFVFASKGGISCSPNTLQRAFAEAKKVSAISSHYTVRSLRYAYIKHLEFLGIPLQKLFDHMGLSKNQSLDFYSRIDCPDIDVTFSPIDRLISETEQSFQPGSEPFVSEKRIEELTSLTSPEYDLTRLLVIIRELNVAYRSNSFMAIAMLIRAILDHVPPIFGFERFNEVVSSYRGSKSFKKSMEHLNSSLRNVADAYLHVTIRKKESLPTFVQVDFRSDLDVLLAEVARLLK